MRNLKRALSMALASVMVLGMTAMGASATGLDDFSDKDKIVNSEAVSILTTLNIINGKDDGSFDPEGIVTRAEMSKMICVVLSGGKEPNLGSTTGVSYTDTADSWASPYIEYCTNLGIVAGDGTGKFNPKDTVTGSEAAKMLLVAIGYDATYEKMVGPQWAMAVDVLANQKDLYDDLDIDPSAGLSRDSAAQMIYNALDAELIEYSYALVTGTDGNLTSIPTSKDREGKTILTERFGAVRVEGVVTANEVADLNSSKAEGSSLDEGKTRVMVTNAEDQSEYSNGRHTFTVSSGMDVLGRSVYLYVKPGNTDEKSTVIGGVVLSSDNKVIVDASSDSIADVADDNDLGFEDDVEVATNYTQAGELTDAAMKADGTAGVKKILIDNDDNGDIDYVLMEKEVLGKVTKYSTKDDGSITVAYPGGSYAYTDSADVNGFDDVGKDDYVLASEIGGVLYVKKPETVVGDLDRYGKDNETLTVDGTKYDTAATPVHGDLTAAVDYDSKGNLNAEATFYLDSNGMIVAVGDVEDVAYTYAYVKASEAGGAFGDDKVKVVLEDGTEATYVINSKSKGRPAGETGLADDEFTLSDGGVYSYSITSDNEIKFTQPYETSSAAGATFTKGKTSIALSNGKTYYANGSTVFFYVDEDDDVTVYTGRNSAPTVDECNGALVVMNKSGDVVSVVFSESATNAAAGDHLFVYEWGDNYDGGRFASVVLDGEIKTGDDAISVEEDDLDEDAVYLYTVNADGEYSLEAPKKAYVDGGYYIAKATVVQSTSDTVVLEVPGKGNVEFSLTDDSVIIDNTDPDDEPIVDASISDGDTVTVILDDEDVMMMVITANAED